MNFVVLICIDSFLFKNVDLHGLRIPLPLLSLLWYHIHIVSIYMVFAPNPPKYALFRKNMCVVSWCSAVYILLDYRCQVLRKPPLCYSSYMDSGLRSYKAARKVSNFVSVFFDCFLKQYYFISIINNRYLFFKVDVRWSGTSGTCERNFIKTWISKKDFVISFFF